MGDILGPAALKEDFSFSPDPKNKMWRTRGEFLQKMPPGMSFQAGFSHGIFPWDFPMEFPIYEPPFGVSIDGGTPIAGWFIMFIRENPMKTDGN